MKQFYEKLKSCAGFTLGEVMATTIILLLATSIIAAGLPLAQRAYYDVVDTANAEVLLSTTVTALRDELSMAKDVKIEGSDISYKKYNITDANKISNSSGTDGIQVYDPRDNTNTEHVRPLVSKAAKTKNLYTTYTIDATTNTTASVRSNGYITLTVTVKKDGSPDPASATVTIRLLNDKS